MGNGTASRESEQVIVDLIKELKKPVQYVIVNEAGASVYSANKLATEEFRSLTWDKEVRLRSPRRLQDPLSELVKIDPKSIGVGQYQHDMNQKKLGEALGGVVEDCVNRVGVDLNTASAPLLEYISGISRTVAKNIVEYREANGRFTNRKQLLKVRSWKAFEQCAGFCGLRTGENPLDATSVHPESYPATMELLKKLELSMEDVRMLQAEAKRDALRRTHRALTAKILQATLHARMCPPKTKQTARDCQTKRLQHPQYGYGDGTRTGSNHAGNDFGCRQWRNRQKEQTHQGRSGAGALNAANASTGTAAGSSIRQPEAAAVSALERRIPDKKKLAEELGIGEITLTDIVKGAGKSLPAIRVRICPARSCAATCWI